MLSHVCASLGDEAATVVYIWGIPLAVFTLIGVLQMIIELAAPHVISHLKLQPKFRITPAEYADAWAIAARSWGIALVIAILEVVYLLPWLGAPSLCNDAFLITPRCFEILLCTWSWRRFYFITHTGRCMSGRTRAFTSSIIASRLPFLLRRCTRTLLNTFYPTFSLLLWDLS